MNDYGYYSNKNYWFGSEEVRNVWETESDAASGIGASGCHTAIRPIHLLGTASAPAPHTISLVSFSNPLALPYLSATPWRGMAKGTNALTPSIPNCCALVILSPY